jgi:immunity protein 53 of polymorphic toxin system
MLQKLIDILDGSLQKFYIYTLADPSWSIYIELNENIYIKNVNFSYVHEKSEWAPHQLNNPLADKMYNDFIDHWFGYRLENNEIKLHSDGHHLNFLVSLVFDVLKKKELPKEYHDSYPKDKNLVIIEEWYSEQSDGEWEEYHNIEILYENQKWTINVDLGDELSDLFRQEEWQKGNKYFKIQIKNGELFIECSTYQIDYALSEFAEIISPKEI